MANIGENSMQSGPIYVPKPVADILIEVSMIPDFSIKLSKLEFYLLSFQEEFGKIEGFKRELPFCVELIKEAIETLKKEKVQWRSKEAAAGTGTGTGKEGFIERRAKWSLDMDKKNWMSTAQLWTTPVQYEKSLLDVFPKQDTLLSLKSKYKEGERSGFWGGSMMRFPSPTYRRVPIPVAKAEAAATESSLDLNVKEEAWAGFRRKATVAAEQKKQRRCWSPELHKRFVDALQCLGGPNSATPKQIRAVMKVEGLTNDEVKSHLQKYRLHIRKLPSSLASTSGYSWLAQDANQDMSKRMLAHSGSPQDHLNLGKGGSTSGGDSVSEDEDD